MKQKFYTYLIRFVLLLMLVYLLMHTSGGDIKYIYANF